MVGLQFLASYSGFVKVKNQFPARFEEVPPFIQNITSSSELQNMQAMHAITVAAANSSAHHRSDMMG